MSCKEKHDFFESDTSSLICRACGVEEYFLQSCTYNNCGFEMRHSPFLSGYSRTKRFRGMVNALFWPTPTNPDSKMLDYLFRMKFTNRNEIIAAVTSAPLKDKRFGSIHIFCRLMDPQYVPPSHGCLFHMEDRIVYEFQCIETRFTHRYVKTPFINYTFLLRHLLTKMGFEQYLVFVKSMKCTKRIARYNKMLKHLAENQIPCIQVSM